MFTGIVEELGTVAAVEDLGDAALLRVTGPLVAGDARPGDSIAVNGVCLTVVSVDGDEIAVSLIPTTLALTTLGRKGPGAPVNLEVDVIAKYVEKMVRVPR